MNTDGHQYTLDDISWSLSCDCNESEALTVYINNKHEDIDPNRLTKLYKFNEKSVIILSADLLYNDDGDGWVNELEIYPMKSLTCCEVIQKINDKLNKIIDFNSINDETKEVIMNLFSEYFTTDTKNIIKEFKNNKLTYRDLMVFSRYFEGLEKIGPDTYEVCFGT